VLVTGSYEFGQPLGSNEGEEGKGVIGKVIPAASSVILEGW
jgi:hypothetical protein